MTDYSEIFARLAPPNLLDSAQKAMTLQHSAQEVQATAMQLRAREALGPILQGAINPETGDLDYKKAFIGMAGNPNTAWMAPDFLDKAVARQGTQVETALKELEKNHKQVSAVYDTLGGLLPMKEKVTRQDVGKAFQGLYETGMIDKDHFIAAMRQLPQDGMPLYNYVQQTALRAQGAAEAFKTTHQAITPHDIGGAEVFTQPDPVAGTVRQVGVLPKTLTPEKKAELVERINPTTRETEKVPYGQAFPEGQSAAPTDPARGGGASASGAPPQPALISKLNPTEQKQWEKMGDEYEEISHRASVTSIMEQQLDTVEGLLKRYHPNALASTRDEIAAKLEALGVSKEEVDKIANGSLEAGQAFKSIMVDFASNRLKAAIGSGKITNMEFDVFQNTKINPNMSLGAIKTLLQYYRRGIKLDNLYIKGYASYSSQKKAPAEFLKWWQSVNDEIRARRREGL